MAAACRASHRSVSAGSSAPARRAARADFRARAHASDRSSATKRRSAPMSVQRPDRRLTARLCAPAAARNEGSGRALGGAAPGASAAERAMTIRASMSAALVAGSGAAGTALPSRHQPSRPARAPGSASAQRPALERSAPRGAHRAGRGPPSSSATRSITCRRIDPPQGKRAGRRAPRWRSDPSWIGSPARGAGPGGGGGGVESFTDPGPQPRPYIGASILAPRSHAGHRPAPRSSSGARLVIGRDTHGEGANNYAPGPGCGALFRPYRIGSSPQCW